MEDFDKKKADREMGIKRQDTTESIEGDNKKEVEEVAEGDEFEYITDPSQGDVSLDSKDNSFSCSGDEAEG